MISLGLACLWLIIAHIVAMLPTRDLHWRAAYVLIAVGLPILIAVIYQNGVVLGLAVLLAGGWVLRWPVYYFARWLKRSLFRRG